MRLRRTDGSPRLGQATGQLATKVRTSFPSKAEEGQDGGAE